MNRACFDFFNSASSLWSARNGCPTISRAVDSAKEDRGSMAFYKDLRAGDFNENA